MRKEDVDSREIVELFTTDPNLVEKDEKQTVNEFILDLLMECVNNNLHGNEFVSCLTSGFYLELNYFKTVSRFDF